MKKVFSLGALALAGVLAFTGCSCNKDETELPALPAARLEKTKSGDKCASNTYTTDCSGINPTNMYQYMNREDTAYIDIRETNEWLAGHFKGFQLVPYNTWIKDNFESYGAPKTEQALKMLEAFFPKDKNLIIMCASGGRVNSLMKILDANGWDMSKVYNAWGMSNYLNTNTVSQADFDKNYKQYYVATESTTTAITYYTGTSDADSLGHTATVYLTVDTNKKITSIYLVSGTEYSPNAAEGWNPETWISKKNEFLNKLVGKNLADVTAMLGTNGATGADVVTGATTVSNTVLRAVKAALEAANAPAA